MLVECRDFNGADRKISEEYQSQWSDVEQIVESMPLHVKASDQAGIEGEPIFDAVGTNAYLKEAFKGRDWSANVPIPEEYRFLGTDVDFGKDEVILEVQFANYPFLLNNLLRSELLYKARVPLTDGPVKLLMVVTKAGMFPASRSTLYFEQAVRQVGALAENDVFDVPIRIVGLSERQNSTATAVWTEYESPRYSRKVVAREERELRILPGRSGKGRCKLAFA